MLWEEYCLIRLYRRNIEDGNTDCLARDSAWQAVFAGNASGDASAGLFSLGFPCGFFGRPGLVITTLMRYLRDVLYRHFRFVPRNSWINRAGVAGSTSITRALG